jgi:hypothetical protein
LIVVDETSTHVAMTRRYARAPRGPRAYGRVPRNRGANLSVSGALGLRGRIATMSVDGAVDTAIFNIFVTQILLPVLHPGDGVVLDNLIASFSWVQYGNHNGQTTAVHHGP